MDCRDYQRLLSREIDGEIDPAEHRALAEHLLECENCRNARIAMREAFMIHHELVELQPPRSLVNDVMDGVAHRERRGWFGGWIRSAVPVAAAIVLVLGIYAGVVLTDLYWAPSVEQQLAALELEYLDEYPPGSMGDFLMEVTEGGGDENGE